MSFDVKVVNGDLSFDSQGRVDLVRDTNKLVQDVHKIIQTTRGYDPFDPRYGLTISTSAIGRPQSNPMLTSQVQAELQEQLDRLRKEQVALSGRQVITAEETIKQIDNVTVEQDTTDPRQINITIELTTQAQSPITVQDFIRLS